MNAERNHPLALYRHAVQHPEAEVRFLARAWGRAHGGWAPTRLREDFAGTAAVAAAWVGQGEDHRAVAVERDPATMARARRHAEAMLGARAGDLLLVTDDVCAAVTPPVQVAAALNFSALGYHDDDGLRAYLAAVRTALEPGGVLVLDLFGGPGAERPGIQRRRVEPPADSGLAPFIYEWEQRSFDPAPRRIDCRIHFELADGTRIENAFRYDWTLRKPAALRERMLEAGFAATELWCDRWDPRAGPSDGRFVPMEDPGERPDWVAYVVGRCGA